VRFRDMLALTCRTTHGRLLSTLLDGM
jgi:hypothetical protein